jgi:hypothetical protein
MNLYLKAGLVVFWGMVLLLAMVTSSHYPGDLPVYILFTLISNLLLYVGFRANAVFFDAFMGVLMWLGFWFKFSLHTAFMDGYFQQAAGTYDGSSIAADNVLLVSSCGLAALILASIVRSRFIFNYPKDEEIGGNAGLFAFYTRFRRPLLVAMVLLIVAVAFSNAWLGIYQRGAVPRTVLPYGLGGVYSWLLLFGMSSFVALVLHFEMRMAGRVTVLSSLLALFENFASSVSLLSRGMIINSSALFYGVLRSLGKYKVKGSFRTLLIVGFIFSFLFIASVFLVNHLRWISNQDAREQVHSDQNINMQRVLESKGNTYRSITSLVLDRWVGVEGVMAVANYPDRGWRLWSDAWSEKFDVHSTSFYDLNLIETPYTRADTSRHHYISLPGVIAFFYYPGSYLFLLAGIFLLGVGAALIEFFVYRFGGRNLVLCALIAQVVAYRFSSFGYVPSRSYLLFGSVFLTIALIWSANRLFQYWFEGRGQEVLDTQ